jgi:YbgC/YbaW family acyl-CoA thioester hydrolase
MSDNSFPFRHRLVVRFSDCDPMGHANHAIYFTYFEQCRLTWWRHLGSTSGLPGAATVIVHAACDYRAPAHVHDELEVRLTLGAIGRTSVTLMYEIVNVATGLRLAEGQTGERNAGSDDAPTDSGARRDTDAARAREAVDVAKNTPDLTTL